MDAELLKILGPYGLGGVIVFLLWRIGERLIAALDRLGGKFEEHTKADLEHHAHVRETVMDMQQQVAHMQGRIDVALELTPVEAPPARRKTNPRGVQVGEYMTHRPRTRPGEDR